jgi:hypothetical protein
MSIPVMRFFSFTDRRTNRLRNRNTRRNFRYPAG